ncbi:MAG TPA: universal stress protein [Planctomycetota bacterium]|nr:universal stress protein [Planctomycetota bacterium]
MIALRRILVPSDFSLPAQRALRYAIEFAKRFDAEILLVHVIEPPAYAAAFARSGPVQETDEERRAYDWFATQLANQAKDEIPDSVRSRTLLLRGTPSAEIAQCAQREDVDLIVMATSGRSGLKDVLLGSTAERVLRRSPCPVLTVHREQARGFIEQAEEEPWND